LHRRRNREGEKMPSLARWDNGTGISWLLVPTPALAHSHTHGRARAHTCHVLLLFITIIVTTGIVFV